MSVRWPGVAVTVAAGTLLVAGCATFGDPFTARGPGDPPARPGPVAVVQGDPGPVATTLAAELTRTLRHDGVTVVPAKTVTRARRAFADDLPVSTTGRYMQKRWHPETPDPALGAQLLQAMHAPVVLVVWGPPLRDIGAGYTVETLVGQLYATGAGGVRFLGYTLYYLELGSDWTDGDIDQETEAAGDRVARAVEARLGVR